MNDHPMGSTHTYFPANADLDLGDGHWLHWSEYKNVRCGGVIMHTTNRELTGPEDDGLCRGAFWLRGNQFGIDNPNDNRAEWDMTGTFEQPTLQPSFLCHCGDHGFVRGGKWVRA